ncbi:hypothetical protein KY316_03405, partial [Candidatus Woesearchaeota archaeon]|nr:hypothetical protein [Candidatus Woesearchaeota archaeon]
QLEDVIKQTFKNRQEGRVCKDPNSIYKTGKKTIDWVKFKKFEPLDLVVVGFYNETQYGLDIPFTGVLCATYNEATRMYETIGKVATTRNGIAKEINSIVAARMSQSMPQNVVFSDKMKGKNMPAFYIKPEDSIVLEVKAMNIDKSNNWQTCGKENGKAYSMRIGFVEQIRDDKAPKQATTTEGVKKLYKLQSGG